MARKAERRVSDDSGVEKHSIPPSGLAGLRCANCGYDLVGGLEGDRCPKCGDKGGAALGHSSEGVAAFVLAIIAGLAALVLGIRGLAVRTDSQQPFGWAENLSEALYLPWALGGCFGLCLIALLIGAFDLRHVRAKRTLSVLGICISLLTILWLLLLERVLGVPGATSWL